MDRMFMLDKLYKFVTKKRPYKSKNIKHTIHIRRHLTLGEFLTQLKTLKKNVSIKQMPY